jgi:WD40 repeat protein
MKLIPLSAAALSAAFVCPLAHGGTGLPDFIVTNASGDLYMVNGNTLEATYFDTVDTGNSINEIEYIGNNTILANQTGIIVSKNLITGEEDVVFRVTDYFTDTPINYAMGLALRDKGDIYFTVNSVLGVGGSVATAASLSGSDFTFTQLNQVDVIGGLYFDSHELANGEILSADFNGERIWRQSSITGETLEIYEVDYGVVSFIELNGDVYTLTKNADMYRFNAMSGESDYIGTLSGIGPGLIGATIPAPSSIAMLGLAGVISARRRR